MNEEEKKEIKVLQKRIERFMKKEIDKQNKVIDLMAQELIDMPIRLFKEIDLFKFTNKEDAKQYFIRKVEENDKD